MAPIEIFTDSSSLFDIITKSTDPTEKRLQIDLMCPKKAYTAGDIEVISFIRSENNRAGFLAKVKANSALMKRNNSSKINYSAKQWIRQMPIIFLVDEKKKENVKIYI